MIAAQGLDLSFLDFLQAAGIPALLSLPIVWSIVTVLYRRQVASCRGRLRRSGVAAAHAPASMSWETIKAAVVTLGVVAAFIFTDWPRALIALAAAGLLLINRRIASADMMKHVDGNLLLMLMGLFIVNAALAADRHAAAALAELRAHGLRSARSGLALRHHVGLEQSRRQQSGRHAARPLSRRRRRRSPTPRARRWPWAPAFPAISSCSEASPASSSSRRRGPRRQNILRRICPRRRAGSACLHPPSGDLAPGDRLAWVVVAGVKRRSCCIGTMPVPCPISEVLTETRPSEWEKGQI